MLMKHMKHIKRLQSFYTKVVSKFLHYKLKNIKKRHATFSSDDSRLLVLISSEKLVINEAFTDWKVTVLEHNITASGENLNDFIVDIFAYLLFEYNVCLEGLDLVRCEKKLGFVHILHEAGYIIYW